MKYALWILQILLGLLFIFAGGSKLIMPIEQMAELARQSGQTPLPGFLLRFIGVAELLGGLGLILPGLLRIKPFLTPLAAAGHRVVQGSGGKHSVSDRRDLKQTAISSQHSAITATGAELPTADRLVLNVVCCSLTTDC